MRPIGYLGSQALAHSFAENELRGLRIQMIADAGAALMVLLLAITLSVYQPFGKTGYGMRAGNMPPERLTPPGTNYKLYLLLAITGLVLLMFVILHLTGTKFHG
jgi:hypothetical protein